MKKQFLFSLALMFGASFLPFNAQIPNDNNLTQPQDVNVLNINCTNQSFNLSELTCGEDLMVISPTISEVPSAANTTLDFDGFNDRVLISNSASLTFTTEFSVQAWIYPRANTYSRIFTKYSGGSSFPGEFVFDTYDGSNPTFLANGRGLRLVFTGANGGGVISPNVLNLNSWNHVAGTFNNGVLRLYVNGVEVNSGTTIFTSIPSSSLGYAIGEDVNVNQNEHFNGQIDELSLWNKALKPSEIENAYDKLLAGTEPGLVAYYDFEDGSGNSVLIDKSGNSNDGVLTNMDINLDWVTSTAPITPVTLVNDLTGISDASGIYPTGDTTITWTATDVNGNFETCIQTISVSGNACGIIYTFDNGVWSPSNPDGLSTADDDIIIESGNATLSSTTVCNSVTVEPEASLDFAGNTLITNSSLVLKSTSTSYSSLFPGNIESGTSANNMIIYKRYVNSNANGNDLISSPIYNLSFADFLNTDNNASELLNDGNTSPTTYAFAPFNKTVGDYVNTNSSTNLPLISGRGYRAATVSGSTLSFKGQPNGGSIDFNIENSGPIRTKWNLVGNPYPTYLNVLDFLTHEVSPGVTNLSLFDSGTAAIYGYDGTATNGWIIYNLATITASTLIAPGQGFFVSANASHVAAYDLEFKETMRSSGTGDDFIAGRNSELVYLKLSLSTNANTARTEIYFNPNASQGFDFGYDAEVFESTVSQFMFYSHLVQDNEGKAIALQTLNLASLNNETIPLGVHANQGEQLTFSIADMNLPASVNVYLDDVVENTSTLLNTGEYVITPLTNLSGTGRFYLRTSEDALSTIENSLNTLNIFALNSSKELVITGELKDITLLNLYDIRGRTILTTKLDATKLENRIDVSNLNTGMYVVNVQNTTQQKSQKVIIK